MDFTDVPTRDLVDIYMSAHTSVMQESIPLSAGTIERIDRLAERAGTALVHRHNAGEADVFKLVEDWGAR